MGVRSRVFYWLGFGAALASFFFCVERSRADVYCVPAAAGGCTQSFTDLQDALDAAAAHPSPDYVKIAAGTFAGDSSGPGGFSYVGSGANNQDSIHGSAMGTTRIRLGNTAGSQSALSITTQSGVEVSDLGVVLPPNDDGRDTGLALDGNVLAQSVTVTGTEASGATGISCSSCELNGDRIDLPSDPSSANVGIDVNGDAIVNTAQVRAGTGILNSGTGVVSITQSRVQGYRGIESRGGGFGLLNSLIALDDTSWAVGIGVADDQPSLDRTDVSVRGVTIVGSDSNESSGIVVNADAGDIGLTVDSTVIAGVDHALALTADDGSGVSLSAAYSALDIGSNQFDENGGGTVALNEGTGFQDLPDPEFVDSAAGDFTPAEGSPLVDAGDPADPYTIAGYPHMPSLWQEQFDVLNHPRACAGSFGAPIRRDIGAVERKVSTNDDCAAPDTSITSGPEAYPPAMYSASSAEFELASTESDSTFQCSVDGSEFSPCSADYVSPELPEGQHTFAFRAEDQFGNVDPSPVSRAVYLGAKKGHLPTCREDRSVCPSRDRKAPKILGLAFPGRTFAARAKIRFRSNEKRVTFTCRLNRAKARKCRSPWTTPRLKRGRNVIRIQATDQAGNKSKVIRRVIRRRAGPH